ncbi:hypothetical protein E2C01_077567 [Portunus trituberculatus]|uniref:THAP-type domain-containing protein n=1 Tax=Portunus trituberculatus TaxID=210409 RepID=A0A5B7IBQ8_PORTR|nr:hypothetical protein [Portunus trituberculatus]
MGRSRHCFIPQCKASSITSPHKRFLTVPRNIELRKLWFRAAQRQGEEVCRSSFWCCPDHFNVSVRHDNIT